MLAALCVSSGSVAAAAGSHEQAAELATQAMQAGRKGDWDECARLDTAAIELEDTPSTRLHRSACRARTGKLLEALRDAGVALEAAQRRGDPELVRAAKARTTQLLVRIAHISFQVPQGVEDVAVTFDGRAVSAEALARSNSADPGTHTVEATGTLFRMPVSTKQTVVLREGESRELRLEFALPGPRALSQDQLRCLMEAASLAESKLCLSEGSEGASLTSRATLELSGYTDDLAINVVSPRVSGQVGNASAGWSANGSYLIDVLSAASPDIVSMASRQYTETRHAGNVGGAYKPKDFGVSASANVSREPDYLSMGAGGAVTLDLENKQVTPRLGYQFSHDTISKKDTPLALFERNLDTHTIDGNVSLVLTPRQALVLGTTLAFERGDQSKPYRYVPMFGAAQARDVRPGASISDVNNDRLSIRPREQLPLARTRVAIGARFVQRYPSGTLRIEERVYVDSWGVKGTTSDGRFLWDVAERLRIGPHLRLHMQTGASFHQLAYVATYDAQGSYTIPQYRTGDRELAPLVTVTAGASVRVGLTPARGAVRLALLLQADTMHTKFINSLFVESRRAHYGTVGVEGEFE